MAERKSILVVTNDSRYDQFRIDAVVKHFGTKRFIFDAESARLAKPEQLKYSDAIVLMSPHTTLPPTGNDGSTLTAPYDAAAPLLKQLRLKAGNDKPIFVASTISDSGEIAEMMQKLNGQNITFIPHSVRYYQLPLYMENVMNKSRQV